MKVIEIADVGEWSPACPEELASRCLHALEHGAVLYFPRLCFALESAEHDLLSPAVSDGRSKNVAYDVRTGTLAGTALQGSARERLHGFMDRYCRQSSGLVQRLLPSYASALETRLTSFRPVEIRGRASSSNKDDTRLHVDAFASRPNQGRRILRVFCNVNPAGKPREWLVGEPFERYAARFAPHVRAQLPFEGPLLAALRLTKSLRTPYDHLMLGLHDQGKADDDYQAQSPRTAVAFPPGTTWMCFTDQVLHAALGGQFLLEQTFLLPVSAMASPDTSPLKVLERMTGRSLLPGSRTTASALQPTA